MELERRLHELQHRRDRERIEVLETIASPGTNAFPLSPGRCGK